MTVFLITGATGNLGGAALRSILDRTSSADVRVLVRNPSDAARFVSQGLTVRVGDYSNRASLADAFVGVDTVVFVSSSVLDPVIRAAQHRAVVESAAFAGVTFVVYTSGMGAEHDPGHSAAEQALADSGVPHTILRNALYTEPFVAKSIADARDGVIKSASDGQMIATAAISDLGECAAKAAVDRPRTPLWELRGPAWTYEDMAKTVSALTGTPVAHEEVADTDTGPFAVLFPLVRRGVFAAETDHLATLLGRTPMSIADVAARLLR
ncbi:NAD(P)H-binding protein [Rhodococcoides yunnanense]|uniref:NAD(P)H-binding protein n=1 Tax=Rhodococcoides yunnanense TaxID=278209 RepID=UPI0009333E49|nr:NAD(P)H-binding protein [Rhodococcus yunnanensis]